MEAVNDIVSNQHRVSRILKGLAASRSLLTLTLPDSPGTLSTTLLDMTPDGIILDQLVQGDHRVRVGSRFSAYCKNKGIPIVFRSEVRHVGEQPDGTFYLCTYPDELRYNQKRTSFRVPVHGKEPEIFLNFQDEMIECIPSDISEGGSKIAVTPDLLFHSGDELAACEVRLDNQTLETELKICHIRENLKRGVNELGVQFHDMSPKHKRLLRDWIFALERKRLKRL